MFLHTTLFMDGYMAQPLKPLLKKGLYNSLYDRLSMVVRLVDYDKYDIAMFINEKGRTRWSELLREFVDSGTDRHISRQTLSNYLKELREEGLVSKTVDPKTLALLHIIRPVYKVTKSGKKRLQKIADRKEIYAFIESASPEEIKKLHEEIDRLKKN